MTDLEFMRSVVERSNRLTYMSGCFKKKNLEKFRKWFYKKGKKSFNWSSDKAQIEWNNFRKAFNIKELTNDNDT